MTTHPRGRLPGLRRYVIPLLVVAAAAMSVPLQAVADAPRAAVEEPDYPPTPEPGSLRTNPQVYAIAQDADYALRYSYAAVASDLSYAYPAETVEADLQEGLRSLPADRLEPIVRSAQTLVRGTVDTRTAQFGRHGRLTVDEFRRIGFDGAFADVRFDHDALKRSLLDRASQIEQEERAAEEQARQEAWKLNLDFSLLPKLKSLDFRVERIKCVDETNPELTSDDEIKMGGLRINHLGTTGKVPTWYSPDEYFYDGKIKNFAAPGHLFTSFDLNASGKWPRGFVAVVMLAEKDGSGFAAAVQAAWLKVQVKVSKVIADAVEGVASAFLGAAIAEALGQFVAWLVTKFVDWLLELFKDDLFEARSAYVKLPHRYSFMYTNPAHLGWTNFRLPTTSMNFVGHGGYYKLNVHWQVNP